MSRPPTILVTAERDRRGLWSLRFVDPCPGCGKHHRHGAGNGLEPVLGVWVSHCANHRPFRPDCKVALVSGQKRSGYCRVEHVSTVELRLAPSQESLA